MKKIACANAFLPDMTTIVAAQLPTATSAIERPGSGTTTLAPEMASKPATGEIRIAAQIVTRADATTTPPPNAVSVAGSGRIEEMMITDDLHQRETRIPIGDSTIEIPAATMEIRQTEIAIPMTTTTQLDADFHVHRGAITMAMTMASRMAKAIQATPTTPDPGSATRILIVRKMAPATRANTTDPIRSRAKATI